MHSITMKTDPNYHIGYGMSDDVDGRIGEFIVFSEHVFSEQTMQNNRNVVHSSILAQSLSRNVDKIIMAFVNLPEVESVAKSGFTGLRVYRNTFYSHKEFFRVITRTCKEQSADPFSLFVMSVKKENVVFKHILWLAPLFIALGWCSHYIFRHAGY